MFAITSTRIVGLIAVVCAVVVAPQALAVPITDSNSAAPTAVPPDAAMGYDLSGFDRSALNNIPGYQQQEAYLQFLARASADTRQSVDAAKKAAAIKALRRRSVDLEAAYRKLHPDAYRPAVQPTVQKSDTAAVWSFPEFCNGQAQATYDSGC